MDDPDFEISEEDKNLIMANVVHFSDISNQTKKWDVCFVWTEYLYEEFWNQVNIITIGRSGKISRITSWFPYG